MAKDGVRRDSCSMHHNCALTLDTSGSPLRTADDLWHHDP